MKDRIDYLDGLRGVAILLVIGYHAYARWPDVIPYGDAYQSFPIFKFGWLGVQLFFLISGFVIFMTLDKTKSFRSFLYKRWLRLFPAMFLASLLIYASTFYLDARPAGNPVILNMIPGLTFIQPDIWSKILGIDVVDLEGAFWSLYVEFKFYVLSGVIYFYIGRKFLAPILLVLYVVSLVVSNLVEVFDVKVLNGMHTLCDLLSLGYFGWFASGSFFYLYCQSKSFKFFLTALIASMLSSTFVDDMQHIIPALVVALFFAASIKIELIQILLTNRFLLFFGFISYPLYLIHENAMVSMIVQFSASMAWLNFLFHPIIPVMILSAIAFLIANTFETALRKTIRDTIAMKVGRLFK